MNNRVIIEKEKKTLQIFTVLESILTVLFRVQKLYGGEEGGNYSFKYVMNSRFKPRIIDLTHA